MIVAELSGGLGNQMFQYAFAKSLASRTKTDFALDLSFFSRNSQNAQTTRRNYELNIFEASPQVLLPIEALFYQNLSKRFSSKLFRKIYPPLSRYIKENPRKFNLLYTKVKSPVYLRGYWQNPKYFTNILDELKLDFKFVAPVTHSTESFQSQIQQADESVAVHFRRTDYLKDPFNEKICSITHYKKAINLISQKKPNAHFFIFSDDIPWVKQRLKIDNPITFVERELLPQNNYEDMFLMTLCKNHIIANSSFSWWGAFLGENQGQIVIAPKLWDKKRNSNDIIMKKWTLL